MTQHDDAMLRELLRRNAPAARDPQFRLRVHERRERALFRRRAVIASAFALAVLTLAAIGTGVLGPGASDSARVLLFGVLLALAIDAFGPRIVRKLPGARRSLR